MNRRTLLLAQLQANHNERKEPYNYESGSLDYFQASAERAKTRLYEAENAKYLAAQLLDQEIDRRMRDWTLATNDLCEARKRLKVSA